ncbi:thioredoxin [Candidatus Woesebacteria bacterium]|nr:thioredoxin [Candidatus Woesebacteria bacterium]MCD8507078.1 thioredoxin [Candidatus Woesebacteria bacterium]MCD8527199.1 thioredoxin [Candidatus Woesebacteria bacterium]MCD8546564.1 thioredoxin [Candidatus Woesebacteria bacterium]
MSDVLYISGAEQFEAEVLSSEQPVLVDFYAEWCGPCKLAAPIMDTLAVEYQGKAAVAKIDVDDPQNRDIAMKYGVMSIPTVFTIKDGEIVDKNIGFIGEDGYRQMIEKGLGE